MVTVFFKEDNRIEKGLTRQTLADLKMQDVLWIDLSGPLPEERKKLEGLLSVKFLTRQQAEEIETTSKYSETVNDILININYYIDKGKTYETEPLSFILTKEGTLITYHQIELTALDDVERRIKLRPQENETAYGVFMTILEAIIDYDADMEELLTREITRLSKVITSSSNIDKAILHRINELQEKSTALREDVYDVERVLNSVVRSKRFPENSNERLTLMIKDAESLINHGDISFSRLDYLQDTTMGLINIEQNEIVKILSVAAVIFMPPTLIASIYGMNFKLMPELDWVWPLHNGWVLPAGYIFAIFLMVLVTMLTYWFFRYKKWL
ncbi:MAG: magnesium and cobalt transport protein CorA [Muribaculaceae bacterium]|nr:magnesium and cobalt transport protein CorA [Muribaculaceae bacterium]